MKKIVAILIVVFLVGCGTAAPSASDSQPANDATFGVVQPSEQAEGTTASLPADDTADENTNSDPIVENSVLGELFAKVIPGDSSPQDIGEILLAFDHPLPDSALKSSGVESHFVTDYGNHIIFVFDFSNINTGIWHTLPHINDWLEARKTATGPVGSSANSISHFVTIADVHRISQENSQNPAAARMEQFADIIPGESTAADICKIMEEDKLCTSSVSTTLWGWKIEFSTDNPSNVVTVDFSSDLTVLRVGHISKPGDGFR